MFTNKKEKAAAWFKTIRDEICAEFETLEREAPESLYPGEPGRFEFEDWQRKVENGGGGTGGMLRGRLFEKDPRFWAAGVSLIAHHHNPHVPSVHMNTRYIVTTQDWFGGGADLTPTQAKDRTQSSADAIAFHKGMKAVCDAHDVADYPKFKKWCDDYFHLHHRDEPRGVGGRNCQKPHASAMDRN